MKGIFHAGSKAVVTFLLIGLFPAARSRHGQRAVTAALVEDHVRLSRDLRRTPELAPLAALLRLARRQRERRLGLEKET